MANLFEKMKQWNKEVSEKIEKREEKRRNSVSYYMDKTKQEMKDAERMVEKTTRTEISFL